MAVKKAAPKKRATTTIKTAKKAASARPAVKVAPKKATHSAQPSSKTAAVKKVKTKAVAKKAAAPQKKTLPLKTPISRKQMTKKAPVREEKIKKEEVKPAPKKSEPVAKKETRPAAKKEVETAGKAPKKAALPTEFKMPKTTIKTSVPYQPEYKTLDQRQAAPNGKGNAPLVRYNDNELNDFRELINKKLDAAKKELAYLQGLITRRDDMGGDEGDNRYMTMEDGSMSMEREQLSQMASRQITYIDHLEKALIRIENKTYGICRVTGKLIDKARLRAVPHATLSLEAKLGLVKPGTE